MMKKTTAKRGAGTGRGASKKAAARPAAKAKRPAKDEGKAVHAKTGAAKGAAAKGAAAAEKKPKARGAGSARVAPAPPAAKPRRAVPARRAAASVPAPPVEEPAPRARVMPLARPATPAELGYVGTADRSGKYVYCIIHATESLRFGPIGIGSEPAEVHTVNFQDIAAVVSDTPLEVYDPTRENVLAHERVNETVMRDFTVIPMSFNTVFKTSEDIVELLRTAYDAFRDVLVKMEDKVEFGLKVLWEPDLVIREIEKDNENLRLLRQEISSQRGSTYFARMQYGRLVDSLLQDRCDQLVAEIFAKLADISIASRANKPIGDKMILNAAFLVDRDREGDFDQKVKEIDARYENLKFKYTGPWPPYNFVNIRLKLERAAEAE